MTQPIGQLDERPCIVLGAGGHARVVIDLLHRSGAEVRALYDADVALRGTRLLDVPVAGGDSEALDLDPSQVWAVNALASTGPATARRALYERFVAAGFSFPALVHPQACVSTHAFLAAGVHVCAGAVVGPLVRLGENCLVNTRAVIEHDCRVGAHAHVAPGATLCGAVSLGAAAHVGAGAVVLQGVTIGTEALVAAGAVAVRHVPDGARVVGVPAKERA